MKNEALKQLLDDYANGIDISEDLSEILISLNLESYKKLIGKMKEKNTQSLVKLQLTLDCYMYQYELRRNRMKPTKGKQ